MVVAANILLVIFGLMAAIDNLYWHIFRLKLHFFKETQTEHYFHTLRNFVVIFIFFFLFTGNYQGLWLWLGVLFTGIDAIVLFIDLLVEADGRKIFGGLPKWEYLIHVIANGIYYAAIALILASKAASQWSIAATGSLYYPEYAVFLGWILTIGTAASFLLHLILCIKPGILGSKSTTSFQL